MIEFVINILIGTILGWYGKDWIQKLKKKNQKRKSTSRLNTLKSEKLKNWLIDYYIKSGCQENLFMASINGEDKIVPFLTKENWFGKCFCTKEFLSLKNEQSNCQVKIDRRLINKRKLLGQTLWNAPFLCLEKIHETKVSITIQANKARYYQFVSRCGALEDETINLINRRIKKSSLRDKYAKTFEDILSGNLGSIGIGVQALIAFKTKSGYKFMIQKRSDEVCVGGGFIAVVPCFGCEPLKDNNEARDVILHNFLREFYEELYDQEELIRNNRRLSEDWFYGMEPIHTLLRLKKKGEFSVDVIGFGIDALTGEINISVLALIINMHFIEQELRRMRYNWEIKGIQLIDYDSDEIAEWLKSGILQPSSAFAITNALNILESK